MPVCSNCKSEARIKHRFCPSCGFKLWQTWDGRSIAKLFEGVEAGKNVHRLAQNKLWKIGKDLGFHSITEFVPQNAVIQTRSELIDVVWKSGDDIEFAFEIRTKESALDVLASEDDVEKLRNLECPKKFLVNVSNKTGKAYFNEIANEAIDHKEVFSNGEQSMPEIELNVPDSDEILKRFGAVEPGKSVRQQAEMKLLKIGTELGFSSYSWYEMPNLFNDGRNRFISVVWKTGNEIAVAFQVRRKRQNPNIVTSLKDRRKMFHLKAKEKYVINISENTGRPHFFRATDWDSKPLEPVKSANETSFDLEERKAHSLDEIRRKHPRAYETWTDAEDAELTKYYKESLSVSQLAEKHQRKRRAILSRLKKLGLIESPTVSTDSKIEETGLVTFLVKSEKHGKICLACVDENRKWIRPIKPGGFDEKDIVMDNGKTIQLFDVVNMTFGTPFPIKHHEENVLVSPRAGIKFVKRLSENERSSLLSEIANKRILNTVRSREDLYNELTLNLNQSLVLAGPINMFGIQCSFISGKTHPRIWIAGPNDKEHIFYITCTDIGFCKFVKSKFNNFEVNDAIISSQDIAELKNKQTYFVIGLTGDSLDEDFRIKDGKYAPSDSSIKPRYWPMVVSVLTIPNYFKED